MAVNALLIGTAAARLDTSSNPYTISYMKLGFVGLGHMGWPMAHNLHEAGFDLLVRDSLTVTQERFAAEHPRARSAPSAAAFARADIVITMLPDGRVVREAILGWDGGIAAAAGAGSLILDMSSSDPSDTLRLARELEPIGVRVVDAPVSGGVPRAVTGELAIMVGGAPGDVERVQPVLHVLGNPARQFRTGGLGSGHAMKALNNYVAAATYCATAEALAIGAKFGLTDSAMIDTINESTGRSFVSEIVFGGEVVTGRYATGFQLGLLAKDVHIAASIASAGGVPAPFAALTDQHWAKALEQIGPAADHSEAHKAW
jgi:3-hydroxyisobutyrate dehydrogenase